MGANFAVGLLLCSFPFSFVTNLHAALFLLNDQSSRNSVEALI